MKFERIPFLLIGVLLTVSPSMGQPDVKGFRDNASGIYQPMSGLIRSWEKRGRIGATQLPTEGLVGYWPFNGNAVDESGNGNDGEVFGGAGLTEDRFNSPNSAYFFDGVDDYISAGDAVILEMDTSMSMMAWIKPDFVHTNKYNGTVLNKEGEYEFARHIEDDEIRYAITNSYPGWYWIPTGYEAPPDEWNHIAIVYDEGWTIVYVNGEPYFIFSGSGTIEDAVEGYDDLRFGNRQGEGADQLFHGIIDDIRIYNRALSAEEVLDIYNEIPGAPLPPITVEVDTDSLHMFVPAEGDTFAYAMTFTNNTSNNQTFNYWTKVLRPIGNPIDPLLGPFTLKLEPNSSIVIDTAQLPVPYDAVTGEYALVAYVGTYVADTLDADTAAFYKLPAIPCEDISQFQSRCRPGGIMQARIILTDASHTGDVAEFTIDDIAYEATVAPNGRALLSLTGFNPGSHDVELTEPPGCYPPVTVTCPTGLGKEGDDSWDDDESWMVPATTALLENYPDPFNPSTTIRYALSEDAHVTLKVYNMLGQLVATLVDEPQTVGYGSVVWNGRNESGANASSGVYMYRMYVVPAAQRDLVLQKGDGQAGSFLQTKRMLLVK